MKNDSAQKKYEIKANQNKIKDVSVFLLEFNIKLDDPVFTRSVVARILDIPVWMLRRLEKEEVVEPTATGRRNKLYSPRELKQLKRIWHLIHERGVKIKGVKVILEMEAEQKFLPRDETNKDDPSWSPPPA
jgi:hypothetical protein